MGSILSNNLTKSYGSTDVLRGFSFEAKPSEITFLAGRNGVGKTTWINVATGIMPPSAGSVLFDNRPVEQARDELGIVFDEPPVYLRIPAQTGHRFRGIPATHSEANRPLIPGLIGHFFKAIGIGGRNQSE